MITLNYFVRRKPDVPADEFRKFWLGRHARQSVVLSFEMGIRKYTKCETLHKDDATLALQSMYGTASDAYDFVDQMVIGDLENFRAGLDNDEVVAALQRLQGDCVGLVDASRSDYWFSIDVPQIFPRQSVCATWENSFLKVFYVPRGLEGLSLQQAQFHWNSCHGALARQFAEFLPYDKYIQGHRTPSDLADSLKKCLGGDFENLDSIIGQAEAWLDRRVLPTLVGPEVERMMRMLVQDIELFVDAGSSHIFATKEHVIHSVPVIEEPVPSLFNVDAAC